jgi:DNA-binding PadR family transcriptional regulator
MSSVTCATMEGMSLHYALIGMLASEPMSGYDLTRRFSESLANVWPAQHSQIYPELARLVSDGMIEQTGEGPRGRKTYRATPEGVEALTEWMRFTEPDYDVRCESGLRGFFLWTLPPEEALAHLERDMEVYRGHVTNLEDKLQTVEWTMNGGTRSARLSVEMGLRYYRMLIEWAEWASAEIAAGALQADGPPPGSTGGKARKGGPVPPPATVAGGKGRRKVAAGS